MAIFTNPLAQYPPDSKVAFPLATERISRQQGGHFRVSPTQSFQNPHVELHIRTDLRSIEVVLSQNSHLRLGF